MPPEVWFESGVTEWALAFWIVEVVCRAALMMVLE
jgi:hypothetical protein